MANDIDSDKIFINDVFGRWYRVPDYQRPYVWGTDQVTDLLDDVTQWMRVRPESEYFLGSIVLQERKNNGITEYDLLDGQQRLTTCLMIHAVGRDLAVDDLLKKSCREAVFQERNPYRNIPERARIIYDIREDVQGFVDKFIKADGGTNNEDTLKAEFDSPSLSVQNMANALLEIRNFFKGEGAPTVEEFFQFFGNNVLLVYVSSPDLDDAFRMFTVLNDRGMRLRGSDILKTSNLRALREDKAGEDVVRKWAQKWEEWEGELGDGFDVFLSQIRAVLVKDKARLSLLQEFDENIYAPQSFDRKTKTYTKRDPLLKRGLDTFNFVDRYYGHYQKILSGNNYTLNNSWQFDNLITLLQDASLADFWLPPLLRYYDVFGEKRIIDFLKKLEAKFCGDWVTYQTPTDRIQAMNRITFAIDEVAKNIKGNADEQIKQLLEMDVFEYDRKTFRRVLETNDIYSRRFARYLLFKLDALYASADTRLQVPVNMSVEHVLSQTPKSDSQWCQDFSEQDRETWTNRIGNLVLISRRKNSSQGRSDYSDKKEKYFKNNVETFPNSVRVMQKKKWDLETLQHHHQEVVDKLCS
ncbi:MAG: DUF262 domain-containing HNH endonuclease family protein [Anaerolineales bacterium]|nr:MAG: DUF262 domain-containing HNH endonuclease family protein [Anaerolineales bacterium]